MRCGWITLEVRFFYSRVLYDIIPGCIIEVETRLYDQLTLLGLVP
jgi:hypothetical protein